MRILVTGAKGLLGSELCGILDKMGYEYYGIDIEDVDICDEVQLSLLVRRIRPDKIIHCAAFTAVDNAELETEKCYKINVEGTRNIVNICSEHDIELLYISTDYVFSGDSILPYEVNSPVDPINEYGKTKAVAERLIVNDLDKFYIIRTSWLFGKFGSNFVDRILQKMNGGCDIDVVCDQIGSPTYAEDLAVLIIDIVMSEKYGIYHATNEGYCTWYDLACEIADQVKSECIVKPVTSAVYKSLARRPNYSVLSKVSLYEKGFMPLRNWRDALKAYLVTIGMLAK